MSGLSFAEIERRARAATRRATAQLRTERALAKRDVAYAGAQISRLTEDWVLVRQHPDDELRWNIERIRVRARDLERNNPTMRHFLRLLGVNVIGPDGFRLCAQVRNNDGNLAEQLNDKIEDGWEKWSRQPTRDGRGSLLSFSRLCLKNVARDGEAFVRMHKGFAGNPYGFALEAVDPDQVDTYFNAPGTGGNEIRMSVEVDQDARPVRYWMWDKPERVFSYAGARKRISVPASEIIHIYDPDRVNQTRGVSWFASVMLPAKFLDAYEEAELVAARVAASKMMIFQRRANEGPGGMPETNAAGTLDAEANPGTSLVLPQGYELATFDPKHPSGQFQQFVQAQLRRIATGLGVSYNGLASDLTSVNFSSMRSGLLVDRDMWKQWQRWWIDSFLRPVYEQWLNMALLTGELVLDSRDAEKFKAVKFIGRGWPWVDPLKDIQGALLAIQTGLGSRQQYLAEGGLDYEETAEELADELKIAAELGINIEPPVDKPPKGGPGTQAPEPGQEATPQGETPADEGATGEEEDVTPARAAHANGNGTITRPKPRRRWR